VLGKATNDVTSPFGWTTGEPTKKSRTGNGREILPLATNAKDGAPGALLREGGVSISAANARATAALRGGLSKKQRNAQKTHQKPMKSW
jgi:hypothetical protein